jgi:hypothetical protein
MNVKYPIASSKGRKEVKLEPEDLVWLHLRKEWFPDLRKSKLMFRANVLLRFSLEFGVSPTFNISELWPYLVEEDEVPLRMTSIQEGEDDEDITMSDTTTPSIEV